MKTLAEMKLNVATLEKRSERARALWMEAKESERKAFQTYIESLDACGYAETALRAAARKAQKK